MKIQRFILLFLLTITSICKGQHAFLHAILDTNKIKNLSVFKYNPEITVNNNYDYYAAENGNVSLPVNINKPQILEIVNRYFILFPNDTVNLKINDYLPSEAYAFDSINKMILKVQSQYDSLGANFWSKNQYTFNAQLYLSSIGSLENQSVNKFWSLNKNSIYKKAADSAFEVFIKCKSIFMYSLPFLSDKINQNQKDSVSKVIESLFINFSKYGYNNRNENFDIAVNNCFVRGLYKNKKNLNLKNLMYSYNDTLKRLIAVSFIKSLTENDITLSAPDLQFLKQVLCNENSRIKDDFCDYYHLKIDYSKLTLVDIFKTDRLIDERNVKINATDLFKNKNVYIDIWASWCAPCIEFIKQLDMKKLNINSSLKIIFVSIDENLDAWKNKSKTLSIPLKNNYWLQNGLQSNLAKTLKVSAVPYIIHIKENRIDILNASKENFISFFK